MKQKQREMENKHRLSREELKQRALLSQLPRFIDMLDGYPRFFIWSTCLMV